MAKVGGQAIQEFLCTGELGYREHNHPSVRLSVCPSVCICLYKYDLLMDLMDCEANMKNIGIGGKVLRFLRRTNFAVACGLWIPSMP